MRSAFITVILQFCGGSSRGKVRVACEVGPAVEPASLRLAVLQRMLFLTIHIPGWVGQKSSMCAVNEDCDPASLHLCALGL